eukprot:Trichotokara_eunicae@DN2095_c0_g1_i2.p1
MLQGFDIDSIRAELEGPYPLRAICGIAGAAMAGAAGLSMLNIFTALFSPAKFILTAYQLLFGILIAVVELKDLPCGSKLKDFAYKWMPCLTIVGGKGCFYLFAGSLGLSFGLTKLLLFIPAACVSACGIVLILFHFGKCNTLQEKYNQSVMYQTQQFPV